MLSDSIFQAIEDILTSINEYDYSIEHKKHIITALSNLYMVQWRLDRLEIDFNSTIYDARRFATEQFNLARKGLLDLD